MKIVVLRMDAPLMSFGGPSIDSHNRTDFVPGRSLLAGLVGNALGYDHRETAALQRLQSRLRIAARRERAGVITTDYQTVDLGLPHMLEANAWTTWGRVDGRAGATATATGTHIRTREYLADALYSVAIGLEGPDETPTVDDVAAALATPARPLFLGRKCCLPSSPLLISVVDARGPLDALMQTPETSIAGAGRLDPSPIEAWWETDDPSATDIGTSRPQDVEVSDLRDWPNQVHVGRRVLKHGLVTRQEG